jgi:hypothetical protein
MYLFASYLKHASRADGKVKIDNNEDGFAIFVNLEQIQMESLFVKVFISYTSTHL